MCAPHACAQEFSQAHTAQPGRNRVDRLICRCCVAAWQSAALPMAKLAMMTAVDPRGSSRQISLLDSRGSRIDIPESGMVALGRQNMPATTALTAAKVSRYVHPCPADLSNSDMSAAN